MKTWCFSERHGFEQRQGPFLAACWRLWWPAAHRQPVQNLSAQRAGIDAILIAGEARVPVEEKVRERDYGDVLIELVSNDKRSTPGWAIKRCRSRLLLYAFADTRRAWVFPMPAVQAATRKNQGEWLTRYGKKVAKNRGYDSINVAVPLPDFLREVDAEHGICFCPSCGMVCDWSDLRGPLKCSMCAKDATFEVKLEAA